MRLMLHPAWPGTFRRTVRHEDQPGVVYTFEPHDPIDVPECDLEGLAGDVGKSLVIPKAGSSKPDYDETAKAAADFEAYVANLVPTVVAEPAAAPDPEEPVTEQEPASEDEPATDVATVLASVEEPSDEEPANEEPELRSGRRKRR